MMTNSKCYQMRSPQIATLIARWWRRIMKRLTAHRLGTQPPQPLLTDTHLIIEFEGDLIAFDLQPSLNGETISQDQRGL